MPYLMQNTTEECPTSPVYRELFLEFDKFSVKQAHCKKRGYLE